MTAREHFCHRKQPTRPLPTSPQLRAMITAQRKGGDGIVAVATGAVRPERQDERSRPRTR
jgi:hypothetical protein